MDLADYRNFIARQIWRKIFVMFSSNIKYFLRIGKDKNNSTVEQDKKWWENICDKLNGWEGNIGGEFDFDVKVSTDNCKLYLARKVENITIKESPKEIKEKLIYSIMLISIRLLE